MKKGNAFVEVLFIGITLFIFGIISIAGFKLLGDFNAQIKNDPGIDNSTKVQLNNLETRHPSLFDGLFVTALVLMWIGAIIASFMIDAHPIFFAIMVLLLIFAIFTLAVLGNSFSQIVASSEFSSAANSFPKTTWLVDNIVLLGIGMALTIIIAMYGRSQL